MQASRCFDGRFAAGSFPDKLNVTNRHGHSRRGVRNPTLFPSNHFALALNLRKFMGSTGNCNPQHQVRHTFQGFGKVGMQKHSRSANILRDAIKPNRALHSLKPNRKSKRKAPCTSIFSHGSFTAKKPDSVRSVVSEELRCSSAL